MEAHDLSRVRLHDVEMLIVDSVQDHIHSRFIGRRRTRRHSMYQFLGKKYRERTLRLVYRIADDVMEILSCRGAL